MNKFIAVASVAAVSLSAVGLVACSSGGGSNSPSASQDCVLQLSGSGSSIYMVFADSNGPVSSSECQQVNSDSGNVAGVSSAVVASLPSGLTSECAGSKSNLSYTVYSDGSTDGSAYADAACSSIQDGS